MTVTSRGRPIAKLVGAAPPTAEQEPSPAELRRRLRSLPGIIPAQGPRALPRSIKAKGGKSISAIVLEDRG